MANKTYTLSFDGSGEVIAKCNYDELLTMLDSNGADYDGIDFDAADGEVVCKVSNPDNLDYIDDITVSW